MAVANGKHRVMVTLTDETLERLDAYCEETGMSRSGVISHLVYTHLQSRDELARLTAQALAERAFGVTLDGLQSAGVSPESITAAQLAKMGGEVLTV